MSKIAWLGMASVLNSALLAQSTVQERALRIDTNVAVPMRDSVLLRADIWRPTAEGRYPTLVYRTPYGKHQATAAFATARKAVARGYAVVLQDVRGRYASDGEFLPYQQEGRDGFDTIEWAAKQSWSNGAIGTFGLSYPGAVQWLAAIESPPSLMAMVPAMTFASPMQFWYSGGVWDGGWVNWINANIATDRTKRLGGDTALHRIAPWYFEWQRHPPYDPWWDWAELRDKYHRATAAVLNLSGWYDDAYGPHGATSNFAGLVAARAGSPARTALVMGPWTHGVPRMNRTAAGEREYGVAGIIDYDETVLRWMDHYVRGVDNGVDREKPVRVFVLGSNRWIEADAWPVPGIKLDTLTLRRPGASTRLSASNLTDPYAGRAGAHDYRALRHRSDIAVFETAPLESDLTVVGAMRAELLISADAPDTDIHVKVYDVGPDGTAFNLMSPGLDVVRASYRNAKPQRELVTAGRRYDIVLPDLLTANTFRRGHRIRVAVMTSFGPIFPSATLSRVTIHHSAVYPFRLILPTLPAK